MADPSVLTKLGGSAAEVPVRHSQYSGARKFGPVTVLCGGSVPLRRERAADFEPGSLEYTSSAELRQTAPA
jgi:hypothetical protein